MFVRCVTHRIIRTGPAVFVGTPLENTVLAVRSRKGLLFFALSLSSDVLSTLSQDLGTHQERI
jgi:hypothetical protein